MAPADAPERLNLRRSRPFPESMAAIARSRSTGILGAFDKSIHRELLFVNGELRAARSNDEKEQLGTWLVIRGHITEDEKALTLLSQGAADAPPLGHLLVKRGCIDQKTLEHELEELAVTIIRRAAAAGRSFSEFVEGRTSDQPDTLPNLTTPQLLLVAAREFRDFDAIRRNLGPLEQVAWPIAGLDTLLTEFTLTPSEAFVISRLDGSRRLRDLCSSLPTTEEQVLSTLYALKAAGIVSIGTAAEEGPTPLPGLSSDRSGSGEQILVVDETKLTEAQRGERARVLQLASNCQRMNHYAALGLKLYAKIDQLEAAWKNRRQKFSADRSDEEHLRDLKPELQMILERAEEAYTVLSDISSKRRYDEVLRSIDQEDMVKDEEEIKDARISREARNQLVEANVKRAGELIRDGEPYLAIRLLEQACDMEPRPQALLMLARLLLRNPLWKNRALRTLRRALEADPRYVDAWLELAEFWRRRQNPERQRKALERAVAAQPDHPRAMQMYRQLMGQRELERLLRRAHSAR